MFTMKTMFSVHAGGVWTPLYFAKNICNIQWDTGITKRKTNLFFVRMLLCEVIKLCFFLKISALLLWILCRQVIVNPQINAPGQFLLVGGVLQFGGFFFVGEKATFDNHGRDGGVFEKIGVLTGQCFPLVFTKLLRQNLLNGLC